MNALNALWWMRLKRRKTKALDSLQAQNFTFLDLPDALKIHTENAKQICRQASLPEAIAEQLRDRCIDSCNSNKEILAAAKREAEALLGETNRDVALQKLEEMRNTAIKAATENVEKIYDFAERLINQFPGHDELAPGYDLQEDMTNVFIHTAFWMEYALRGLSSGLRYITKKQDQLMAGDSKPLDAATDQSSHQIDTAVREIRSLFALSFTDYVVL
ncbi:hypothetical protein GGR53DRAFT_471960 [Hypoxylon sp. FL1150]|nr:hypothetical protein GGR53DRAFT_471960 [Hypoxylon sp. FL1150]